MKGNVLYALRLSGVRNQQSQIYILAAFKWWRLVDQKPGWVVHLKVLNKNLKPQL